MGFKKLSDKKVSGDECILKAHGDVKSHTKCYNQKR